MPDVSISEDAMNEIMQRVGKLPAPDDRKETDIPLLIWSHRTYSDDRAGNHTELGPMFSFLWTNKSEIEENDYCTTVLKDGRTLALAPGAVFRCGMKQIVLQNSRLLLIDGGQSLAQRQ